MCQACSFLNCSSGLFSRQIWYLPFSSHWEHLSGLHDLSEKKRGQPVPSALFSEGHFRHLHSLTYHEVPQWHQGIGRTDIPFNTSWTESLPRVSPGLFYSLPLSSLIKSELEPPLKWLFSLKSHVLTMICVRDMSCVRYRQIQLNFFETDLSFQNWFNNFGLTESYQLLRILRYISYFKQFCQVRCKSLVSLCFNTLANVCMDLCI